MSMKKGTSAVTLVGAILIFLFSVYATWSFVYGKEMPKPEVEEDIKKELKEELKETCNLHTDCETHPDGSRCMSVHDPNFPDTFVYACGCRLREHCISTPDVKRGNTCGQNDKCE